MKLKRDETGWMLTFDKEGNSFICSINQWGQLGGKMNWYDFTLIEISAENDIMAPGYEVTFIILGLGCRLRVNRSWKDTKLQQCIDDFKLTK